MVNVSDEFNAFVNTILAWLPRLIGALIILLIGYFVSLALKALTTGALKRLGINKRINNLAESNLIRRLSPDTAQMIGGLVYWLAMIVTISLAIISLGSPALNQLVIGVYNYVPNILAAIIILGVAIAISAGVSGAINRIMGDTPTGKIVATALPVLIMAIAAFMILEQLKIAPTIVTITYIALLGSLALGFAIAFGLGAQGVAARIFEETYEKGRAGLSQAREDIRKGRERSKTEIEKQKKKMEG